MQRFFLLLISAALHANAFSQIYNPVKVRGFNHDVVAEGAGNSSSATTTTEMDALIPSNFVLCTREFANANGFQPANVYGLPDSGRFSVPGRTFQMAAYDSLNVLFLKSGRSGALILRQPARYTDFSLLALATEGDAQVGIRFHFSDGTSLLFNKTIEDWFNALVPPTFSGYGRVKRKDGPFFAGDYEAAPTNPRFRNLDFILPCEKTLDSIAIQNTGPPGSESFRAFILAASGLERKANPRVTVSSIDTMACAGEEIRIVASADSGGSSPVFNWFVNGNPVTGQDSIFTSSTLQNGDSVYCTLESSLYCAVPDSVASNVFTVRLKPLLNPAVKLIALDSLLCEGDSLHLKAQTENCGTNPVFRWYLNGGFIRIDDSLFTLTGYSRGDSVSCIVKVSGNCLSSDKAQSNSVSVPVQVPVKLEADLPEAILSEEGPLELLSRPIAGTWDGPGVNGILFSPLEAGPGPKILKAYLPGNTCSDTLKKEILVIRLETTTLILGSGVNANKCWTVEKPGLAYSEKASVEIYNRWGKLVKSEDDYRNDWDGSDVGPGCYFFKVSYTIPGRANKIIKTGHLTFMP